MVRVFFFFFNYNILNTDHTGFLELGNSINFNTRTDINKSHVLRFNQGPEVFCFFGIVSTVINSDIALEKLRIAIVYAHGMNSLALCYYVHILYRLNRIGEDLNTENIFRRILDFFEKTLIIANM